MRASVTVPISGASEIELRVHPGRHPDAEQTRGGIQNSLAILGELLRLTRMLRYLGMPLIYHT